MPDPILLAAIFFGAAVLYSSVGHAGASAYLAAMGLLGVAPDVARPTALALNIVVAAFVTLRFWRRGHVAWRALAPFLVGSVPLAFIGGTLPISGELYKQLVGAVLLVAAVQLARTARRAAEADTGHAAPNVPTIPAIALGAVIGLLSGLTGTGGGIFLTPLLVLTGWTGVRDAAGLSGAFILVNSLSGIAGLLTIGLELPSALPAWIAVVVAGGLLGSWLGAQRFTIIGLRRVLALVLVLAAAKLVFLP